MRLGTISNTDHIYNANNHPTKKPIHVDIGLVQLKTKKATCPFSNIL